MTNEILWSSEMICLNAADRAVPIMAEEIYQRTCRTIFEMPGFCVLNVGDARSSIELRRMMFELKREMANIHLNNTNKTLIYLSATRFDQQTTTKPHIDGGPEECFLMLGYEPTEIDCELEISDYTKCAFDLGMTPLEFLEKYNPMFRTGYEMLRPYTTRIPCYSTRSSQIICINNSSAPWQEEQAVWQGTMHTARILNADQSKSRVINSTLIAPATPDSTDIISEEQLNDFLLTSHVRRENYEA